MSFRLLFSGDLLTARAAKGWTQPAVADAALITLREYQNIEAGRNLPSVETFLRLVYLFDMDIDHYQKALNSDAPLPLP